MFKAPICNFCIKTGILCPDDTRKLKEGAISELDVETSIRLGKLVERSAVLNNVTLVKALEVDGELVLLLEKGDVAKLKAFPETIGLIERSLGRKVWFLESGVTDRKLLEDLFYPIRIVAVNILWLPDGSKLTKVILPLSKKLANEKLNLDLIKKVAKVISDLDIIVEFGWK